MKFSFLVLLLIAQQSFADGRHLLYFGGGGDPTESKSTIFDDGLRGMGSYLNANPWQSEIRFNGGHTETEKIIDQQFTKSNSKGPFTADTFNKMIEDYKNKISSGEIKPGEQLLVMIDSHGAQALSDEKTHQIAVGTSATPLDKDGLTNTTTVCIDSLQTLSSLAKEKGIKLAIVDMSCHSGSSLSLANSNTCVISSTGPNHYGYNTFSEGFIANMKKGKNLEEVFLKTRLGSDNPSFPMISTPAGLALNQSLYEPISPYLHYGKLNEEINCTQSHDPLVMLTDQIHQLSTTLNDQRLDKSTLTQLAKKYADTQKKSAELIQSWNLQNLKNSENLNCQGDYKDLRYTWGEIVLSMKSFPSVLNRLNNDAKNAKNPKDSQEIQDHLDCFQKVVKKGKDLQLSHPELFSYADRIASQEQEMFAMATAIAVAENKLYQTSYEDLSKKDHTPNPCKDFKL